MAVPDWCLLLLLLSQLQEVLQGEVDPSLGLLHLPDVEVQVDRGGLRGGAGGEAGEVLRDVIVRHGAPQLVVLLRPALEQEDVVTGLDY